ncbi:MAG: FAD-dependent oxidoreductase [Eubacteriales bacterium]|nr:FAD-dependent oxidoreductase [Eubacteriales bacterium]
MENKFKIDPERFYDVVVIGGGPAGLTAALYLARARYRVLVVEKERFGGQITITSEVVNYPGVASTDGAGLTETMRRQAESFGAEFLLAEAERLELSEKIKQVVTSRGTLYCFGVLLATGAHPRMIGFQGEAEFRGHGVAYCATCDGEFFTGKEVFVVGGGFAAAEEGVFLTKYAKHVTMLVRGDDFTCAKATAEAAKQHEKITVLYNTEVDEAGGDSALRFLKYHNNKTGEHFEYKAEPGDTFGVFVFAGYEPATDLVRGIAELDAQGYIVTDRAQKTCVDGLYAAGDICEKNLRQVVTAVGDGALAATELERYAAKCQEETGLHPVQPAKEKGANAQHTPAAGASSGASAGGETGGAGASSGSGLFTGDMLAQLENVFARMAEPLVLKVYRDERPVSDELWGYMQELSGLTDKLRLEEGTDDAVPMEDRPAVRVMRTDGSFSGLAFHGVPGGHEFTSFVLGLYNAAGPGQALDGDIKQEISEIEKPVDIRIMVSLSCTMCPELVTAAQRIAAENPNVHAEVYDLNHFPALKDKYQVMSVPCMVINDGAPAFGKKNVPQVLGLIRAALA